MEVAKEAQEKRAEVFKRVIECHARLSECTDDKEQEKLLQEFDSLFNKWESAARELFKATSDYLDNQESR